MKISVIIPVYNSARYIRDCIESILNNSFRDIEVICIDDGSKDNSLDILNEIRAKDGRVQVFSQENKGVSNTRNRGIDIASGDYIAFVDADDWVHPMYFQILVDMIRKNDADISIVNHMRVNDRKNGFDDLRMETLQEKILSSEEFFSNQSAKYYVWGKLFRTTLIKNQKFNESLNYGEDVVFNADVLMTNPDLRIAYMPVALYVYYDNSESAVHVLNYKNRYPTFECLLEKADRYTGEYRDYYILEVMKQSLSMRYQCRLMNGGRADIKKINGLLKKAMHAVSWKSAKQYFIYKMLYLFPKLYRGFIIYKDRSMLKYETQIREKRKRIKTNKYEQHH